MKTEPSGPTPGPFVLTVDVEEWYHTCLVPDLVRPEKRPNGLARELDWLLPEVLDLLADSGARATFFVLGEIAQELPGRVREIAAAGHEVASHSFLHLRVNELGLAEFRSEVERSKKLLEDLLGQRIIGFRAPEWSMRRVGNPRLGVLAELGFVYDSSLAPFLGAGSLRSPRDKFVLRGRDLGLKDDAASLLELPPLTLGRWLRLPAGSWTGRHLPLRWIRRAGGSALERGGLPVLVVHPWELSGRPTPGRLPGFAGFVHEFGRLGFRSRFQRLLEMVEFQPIAETLSLEAR